MEKWIPGIGTLKNAGDFIPLEVSDGGPFKVGEDGVRRFWVQKTARQNLPCIRIRPYAM